VYEQHLSGRDRRAVGAGARGAGSWSSWSTTGPPARTGRRRPSSGAASVVMGALVAAGRRPDQVAALVLTAPGGFTSLDPATRASCAVMGTKK